MTTTASRTAGRPRAARSEGAADERTASSRAAELPALRLALAGGGTGGHVVPGVHLLRHVGAEEETRLEKVLWFGAGRRAETRALRGVAGVLGPDVGFEKIDLPLEGPAGGAPGTLDLLRRTPPAVRVARRALLRGRVQVVCGLGGFTALPVVLAARSLGVPVALLEVNALRGRATRWLAPLARRVLHVHPESAPSEVSAKHRVVGPLLGPTFLRPPLEPGERRAVRRELGLPPERPLLLVLGGSQGAGFLNHWVREHRLALAARGVSVLHQVGPGRGGEAPAAAEGYRPVEFLDGVDRVLRAADAVLTRGGASTLLEIAGAGTPALVVPYPHHADGHQRANAEVLARRGHDVVVHEESSGSLPLLQAVLDHFASSAPRPRSAPEPLAQGARQAHAELLALARSHLRRTQAP